MFRQSETKTRMTARKSEKTFARSKRSMTLEHLEVNVREERSCLCECRDATSWWRNAVVMF